MPQLKLQQLLPSPAPSLLSAPVYSQLLILLPRPLRSAGVLENRISHHTFEQFYFVHFVLCKPAPEPGLQVNTQSKAGC